MMKMPLEEAVLYICAKVDTPALLGKTKLNKILWFADCEHYRLYGTPITSAEYIKDHYGPVPRGIDDALSVLSSNGRIAISKRRVFTHEKNEYFAIEDPKISSFEATHISTLDTWIETVTKKHTASSISELSHDRIWELAERNETVPFDTIYSSVLGEITQEDIEALRE